MIAIRDWWLNYDIRLKEIDTALDDWHDNRFGKDDDCVNWLDKLNTPDTIESKTSFDYLHELERLLDEEMKYQII